MANNSYTNLVYIVTLETLGHAESALAAFLTSADAEEYISRRVDEEVQLSGCFRVDYAEGAVTCWLDQFQPDDRNTYRIRKTL